MGHRGFNASIQDCSQALDGTIQNFALATLSLIILVGGPGSIIVAVAIYRRQGILDRPSYYLLLGLIVVDGLVCITEVPMDLMYWSSFPNWPAKGFFSDLWNSYSLFLISASVLSICSISIDRYLAVVVAPLKYNSMFTTYKAKVVVITIWLYSLAVSAFLYFKFNTPADFQYSFELPSSLYTVYLVLHVLLPFMISIYCCVRVYMIGRGILRQVYQVERVMMERQKSQEESSGVIISEISSSRQNRLIREMKLAKTVAAVLSGFIIVYVPFATVQLIGILRFGGIRVLSETEFPCILYQANSLAWLLSHLNNGLDPILTLYIDHLIRMESKRLLFGRKRVSIIHRFHFQSSQSSSRSTVKKKVEDNS